VMCLRHAHLVTDKFSAAAFTLSDLQHPSRRLQLQGYDQNY
jgi:hypothetical protein